jgi:peptidyl-prolyl cis-trans isomerase A (cyclophilin A)
LKRILSIFALLGTLFVAGALNAQDQKADPLLKDLEAGLYARVDTSLGCMIWKLHYRRAPSAVYNFVGLATGTRDWTDPTSKKKKKARFYDGLKFHKVAPGMLVQGGCPAGTGSGGPGYTFAREIDRSLRHDSVGVVSMLATAQGISHGSQFFMTLSPTPKLNGLYTIFAKVVRGKDVLEEIGAVDINPKQEPLRPVWIKSVTIHPIGDKARSWDPVSEAKKNVPGPKQEADPGRRWSQSVSRDQQMNVQLIVIHYKELRGASLACPYSKDEALLIAKKLVAVARQKGADFTSLEKQFSDARMAGTTLQIRQNSPRFSKMFKDAFTLKTGQVSDPLDLAIGWCILYRPRVVMARHILVTWKGGPYEHVSRTKAEARLIADDVRKKLVAGTYFVELLTQYHDPLGQKHSARGRSNGSSAFFADHEFAPIGPAVFKLKDFEVSQVLESSSGFYIVQRVVPISVRHILISWRGNKRVPGIKRSRVEAKKLAEDLHKQLMAGARFDAVLPQSDDKVTAGGEYIDIAPEYMVKEFSDVAFKLKVKEKSRVVETPFGYHIIQRTK